MGRVYENVWVFLIKQVTYQICSRFCCHGIPYHVWCSGWCLQVEFRIRVPGARNGLTSHTARNIVQQGQHSDLGQPENIDIQYIRLRQISVFCGKILVMNHYLKKKPEMDDARTCRHKNSLKKQFVCYLRTDINTVTVSYLMGFHWN